jgi:hypothetical protein
MHKYKFSYKADSSAEVVGSVLAASDAEAIKLIAEVKRLTEQQVSELFNIKRSKP